MGAHTGSQKGLATLLREHWFKEYLADSNTPGNMDRCAKDYGIQRAQSVT